MTGEETAATMHLEEVMRWVFWLIDRLCTLEISAFGTTMTVGNFFAACCIYALVMMFILQMAGVHGSGNHGNRSGG